jgi:hypothetical protein
MYRSFNGPPQGAELNMRMNYVLQDAVPQKHSLLPQRLQPGDQVLCTACW